MDDARAQRLTTFVEWVHKHITGDEKSEAQVFLDRLLQAFGHGGVKEAGATLEMRVRSRDRKGTAFADLVWKPYVLIEMKKRGEDLTRHYRQAFDYWTHLVPNRPRYVILCNFDEFRVYDFETQMDVPVDTVALADLPTRYDPLTFLFPNHEPPKFGNHHEKVTRRAADRLATCFNKLMVRHVDRAEAQRFTLQMLVAFFAEDIGLLPHSLVARLLADCKKPEDTYDLLGDLFTAMNTPGGVTGGRFKGVDYFNGGLFAEPVRLELLPDEVAQLETAADFNWSMVRPEIFGTIFEHTLQSGEDGGTNERRAFGAHFTHPTDIMKIVGPTIVQPWTELIENATTLRQLEHLRDRMQRYTVLDPACGSGNFLYIAYRELKRLEASLAERMAEKKAGQKGQRQIGFVRANQFFGIDINPFAVEIAKVTMMIARKLAIDELRKEDERPLPLDNLDENFIAGDALIEPVLQDGQPVRVTLFSELEDPYASGKVIPTRWPKADVIIGNPPFAGSRYLPKERGYPYTRCVRKVYPGVPKMADYCVYWLRKAHDHLPVCTPEDPIAGRAGLVGTQNIRNNQSRVGGLDYIVKSGTIVEAVDNQPWSGEANVHVSIVNWVKTADSPARSEPERKRGAKRTRGAFDDAEPPAQAPAPNGDREGAAPGEAALLIPSKRRLWCRVAPTEKTPLFDRENQEAGEEETSDRPRRKNKAYDLSFRETRSINSALSDGLDLSSTPVLTCNTTPQRVFQGQTPCHSGFLLAPDQAQGLLKDAAKNVDVLVPYLIGRDLLSNGKPSRWAIDFGDRDLLQASSYQEPFEHVRLLVMPTVLEKARTEKCATGKESTRWTRMAERWWQFRDRQPGTLKAICAARRFIACSRVTKRPVFVFVNSRIHPDSALMVFSFPDDYSFGILQSSAHWQWFIAKCSKLKSDFRYTPESVFDTFPWPQAPTKKQVNAVAAAGREIRRIRAEALPKITGGLRALYRTLELPGKDPLKDAHAALDDAVLDAYGFDPKGDLLGQLLALNLSVAAKIERGEAVTAPGVPPSYGDAKALVTDDCIRP